MSPYREEEGWHQQVDPPFTLPFRERERDGGSLSASRQRENHEGTGTRPPHQRASRSARDSRVGAAFARKACVPRRQPPSQLMSCCRRSGVDELSVCFGPPLLLSPPLFPCASAIAFRLLDSSFKQSISVTSCQEPR